MIEDQEESIEQLHEKFPELKDWVILPRSARETKRKEIEKQLSMHRERPDRSVPVRFPNEKAQGKRLWIHDVNIWAPIYNIKNRRTKSDQRYFPLKRF